MAANRQAQCPDALNGIHAVPHPCIAVVAVNRVRGAGGKQATDRVLALQHHLADGAVKPLDQRLNAALFCGGLCRLFHHAQSICRP